MSKGTELAIVATFYFVWVVLAKFTLIFLRVVKIFDSVMCFVTVVTLRTSVSVAAKL